MFKIILIIFVVTAATIHAQPLLTLEDAIAIGLKDNYSIKILRNQEKMAQNNKGNGIAGFLPTLSLSGGYNKFNLDQEIDLPPTESNTDLDNLNADLTLNWTIFDGFKMFYDNKKYKEQAQLTKFLVRDQIENLVVAISQAYYYMVLQEQLHKIALEREAISEQRLKREEVRNELGGASRTDFYNAQVSFNSDQSDLYNQELEVKIAQKQLNTILGRDPNTEFVVTDEIIIPELKMSFDDILNKMEERNSSLIAARLNKKVAERNVQSLRSPFMPRLSFYANYGYTDQIRNSNLGMYAGSDITTKTTETQIGLNLSLNLFNGGRDRINLKNAKYMANNYAYELSDTKNKLMGDVKVLYDTFNQRMKIARLEEQNLETARLNMNLQQEKNELGVATSLEFRDAQVNFARAKTALFTARYQTRISRLEIEKTIGLINLDF